MITNTLFAATKASLFGVGICLKTRGSLTRSHHCVRGASAKRFARSPEAPLSRAPPGPQTNCARSYDASDQSSMKPGLGRSPRQIAPKNACRVTPCQTVSLPKLRLRLCRNAMRPSSQFGETRLPLLRHPCRLVVVAGCYIMAS